MADKNYRIEGDTLIINDGVTEISTEDFHKYDVNEYYKDLKLKNGIANIKSIIIPDSVISIGDLAFADCESLENITMPDGVISIGKGAFSRCYNLESITIPDSVTSIGNGAFAHSSLKSVIIPESVTNIGNNMFSNCYSLKSISIPNSVINIDDYAFNWCTNLTIKCNKGSYAEEFAAKKGIPTKHIKDKTKVIERE